jgi:hypothetical protein
MASSFLRAALKMWSLIVDRQSRERSPEVVLHDPKAQGPQNLDNPFLDTKAQARVGDLIGRAARRSIPAEPHRD